MKGDSLYINGETYTVGTLEEGVYMESEEEAEFPKSNSAPSTPTPSRLKKYRENEGPDGVDVLLIEEPTTKPSKDTKKLEVG
ncbi:hypothetical protein JTB14_013349 [Gonioctena quinquepunctata]|nr:hypothetical protein JTB14_013349 [Gonioctena quinquepunctata]